MSDLSKVSMSNQNPKTLKLGPQFRALSFARDAVNAEARTVLVSFSSEEPVARYYGNEVLDHSPAGCDLSRLNNGAPLLCQHDPDEQIGIVESAYIKDGRGYATLRFSKGEDGEEAFQDVTDGIRTKISVGYRVEAVMLESVVDGLETYRVTRWLPYEISLVSIPADDTVGVGRAGSEPTQEITPSVSPNMKRFLLDAKAPEGGNGGTPPVTFNPAEERSKILKEEQKRSGEILAIADKFSVARSDAQRFIAEGKTADEFRAHVLELRGAPAPIIDTDPTLRMGKALERYSLKRAISIVADGKTLDGIEGEAAQEFQRKLAGERKASGFWVPHEVLFGRALNVTSGTAGGFLVGTSVEGGQFIELLRNRTVVEQLGCRTLRGLVGNISIPRATGGATSYWLPETGTVTATDQSFGQIGLTPHRLVTDTVFSKELMAQASLDVESLVRDDMTRVANIALDLAALAGTGNAGQPTGVANWTGVGSVTFGAAATFAKIVEFETDVATANADGAGMAYVMSAATRGKLKTATKIASSQYSDFIYQTGPNGEGMVNGYRALVTNQLGSANTVANQVIFGVWPDLILAGWAGIDVVVDPYSSKKTGQIEITVTQWADSAVRHAGSFAISSDSGAQ